MKKLLGFDWNSPKVKAFDWVLAIATLAVGIYLQSTLWIVAGIVGAVCAWLRPMARVQAFFQSMVKTRQGRNP